MRQADPRHRTVIDMSGIEQGEERPLALPVNALNYQPTVIVAAAGSSGENRLSGHHVGAEIEHLRLAAGKIHALDSAPEAIDMIDSAIRHGMGAGAEITDIVFLHRGARIDHRKFVRTGIENFLAQRPAGEVDAVPP